MSDLVHRWHATAGLGRALVVGGAGVGVALAVGRPALVAVVAPLLLLAAVSIAHRPEREPRVRTELAHRQLQEGQGTRSPLVVENGDGVEFVTRVAGQAPYVALHPAGGVLGHLAESPQPLEISPRRWGLRLLGEEKVGLTSRWAGYRWGPVGFPPREIEVLPVLSRHRSGGEAPQPIGLIGAHRSRRERDGSEFSSIRVFHSGDRLRRINWRVSLKEGTLHVVSTRAEEDTAILLIVDALADYGQSEGVGAAESSLDVTVRAAAAIAEQYLRGGDRVSVRVVSPGAEYVGYGAGSGHLRRILTRLAHVRPGLPHEVDVEQIDFRATAGSVVIVLSPMLSGALAASTVRLVHRGLPVMVVDTLPPGVQPAASPNTDPAVAALAWRMRLIDREQVLTRLAAAGCPVVPWAGPRTLEEVMRRLARRAQVPRMVRA